MITWNATKSSMIVAFWMALSFAAAGSLAEEGANLPSIHSVEVNGQPVPFKPGREANLGSSPRHIVFSFDAVSNTIQTSLPIRCKLEGIDNSWREGGGEMYFTIRYCNEAGDRVGQTSFIVRKHSPGWNDSLESSTLTHRRETLTVPPNASRLLVVISSAGPPSTMGVYVVDDLVVSRLSANDGKPEILLRSPFEQESAENSQSETRAGWERDGTHPSMAKTVEIGQYPKTKAFAIVDDDRFGHAEWHNTKLSAPAVSPNDRLVVEWNEMFSIGDSATTSTAYDTLAPGHYRFRVEETTVFGKPTGVEASLAVRVPIAFWETAWFWALLVAVVVGSTALIVRHVARLRLQRAMLVLRQQHALERERLRIAQDIHDDLGSRVTQISMVSAMALNDSALSEKTRA